MIILERCEDCRRLLKVLDVEPYEVWYFMEEQKMWKKRCWPCKCKNNGLSDHKEYIEYSITHGCGCK